MQRFVSQRGELLEKYRYNEEEKAFLEGSCIPFAAYQFINKRVVTIVLSDGFFDLFGFDKADKSLVYDLMDNNLYRDTHPDDLVDLAYAAYRFATEGGDYDVVYRNKKDGEYRIIHAYGKHVYKEDGTRLAFVWYTDQGPFNDDGTEDKTGLLGELRNLLVERSIGVRVSHDYLTRLPAMTYFFELAEEGCRQLRKEGKKPAILFFDFNGMKNYNHKFGLAEGDRFLKAFSEVLISHFGHNNSSRFNADHFCVYTDYSKALEEAKKIIESNKDNEREKKMPLRVGIYCYDDEGVSISAACDRAKIACDSHRNVFESKIYLFDMDMADQIEKRAYVVENLEKAIANGWTKVFYQPIVRSSNGKVCAEEALSRWDDPEKGFLNPGEFIPSLEESGNIYKLDLFVVDSIIKRFKDQEKRGYYIVPVSVNLSRSDFYNCDIVEEIRKRIDEAGISRDRLIIEITESAVVDDLDYMAEEIKRFKELGFSVWMDDYGSGYSSPTMLHKIPFDLIKIDMLFVRQIGEGEKARIIITEIVKMAMALGIDTIAEGIENKLQYEFLNEIGCSMLQGFYFCKPITYEDILERNKKGIQIGFENPKETGYYTQLGRVNLYELSVSSSDDESLKDYFDIIPMLIVECQDDNLSIVRCNASFREFFERSFSIKITGQKFSVSSYQGITGKYSLNAILQCAADGKRIILDDRTLDGKMFQILVRRVAVNPVTKVAAVLVAFLSTGETTSDRNGLTYNYIARALSKDYIYLYFINLDTGEFTEYSHDGENGDVSVERNGKDFFKEAVEEVNKYIYESDLEEFRNSFTKEKIEQSLKENGVFTLTYRNLFDGEPYYVNMKIVRGDASGNNVILGINNIDAQMKQKVAFEKLREERLAYSRIAALSGDYIALYTIDPKTEEFVRYLTSDAFETSGVTARGDKFYERALQEAGKLIYEKDISFFKKQLNRKNVMGAIEKSGVFILNYRISMDGRPVHVRAKAVKINEDGTDKIIMGIENIDEEVRKEKEFANAISVIKAEVNIDELTGVKTKHAYNDMETQLDMEIEDGTNAEFALAVFDINGLKEINDTLGHQAGDQYIIDGCNIICRNFKHSPVYRLGGDEFALIAQGIDYERAEELMEKIERTNRRNKKSGKVVVAAGMAKYAGEKNVAELFRKADKKMYDNKRALKEN